MREREREREKRRREENERDEKAGPIEQAPGESRASVAINLMLTMIISEGSNEAAGRRRNRVLSSSLSLSFSASSSVTAFTYVIIVMMIMTGLSLGQRSPPTRDLPYVFSSLFSRCFILFRFAVSSFSVVPCISSCEESPFAPLRLFNERRVARRRTRKRSRRLCGREVEEEKRRPALGHSALPYQHRGLPFTLHLFYFIFHGINVFGALPVG